MWWLLSRCGRAMVMMPSRWRYKRNEVLYVPRDDERATQVDSGQLEQAPCRLVADDFRELDESRLKDGR